MKKVILMAIFLLNAFHVQAYSEGYKTEDVEFVSHENKLSWTIVFPTDGKIHSAIVFVHGSGKQTRNLYWGKRFASAGIATLVYDKWGVGLSSGNY